jgi:hypothetical protein
MTFQNEDPYVATLEPVPGELKADGTPADNVLPAYIPLVTLTVAEKKSICRQHLPASVYDLLEQQKLLDFEPRCLSISARNKLYVYMPAIVTIHIDTDNRLPVISIQTYEDAKRRDANFLSKKRNKQGDSNEKFGFRDGVITIYAEWTADNPYPREWGHREFLPITGVSQDQCVEKTPLSIEQLRHSLSKPAMSMGKTLKMFAATFVDPSIGLGNLDGHLPSDIAGLMQNAGAFDQNLHSFDTKEGDNVCHLMLIYSKFSNCLRLAFEPSLPVIVTSSSDKEQWAIYKNSQVHAIITMENDTCHIIAADAKTAQEIQQTFSKASRRKFEYTLESVPSAAARTNVARAEIDKIDINKKANSNSFTN